MWYSREGPRVFWLSPGEASAQARDPFISVRIRSQVGTSRHILRLPVGRDVSLYGRTTHCFGHSHVEWPGQLFGLPRWFHHQSEAKEKRTGKNSRYQLWSQICTAMPIKHPWQTITGRPCFENIISVARSHAAARSNCLPCATLRL